MVSVEVNLVEGVDLFPQKALGKSGDSDVADQEQAVLSSSFVFRNPVEKLFIGNVGGKYETRLARKRGASGVAAGAAGRQNIIANHLPC